MKTHLRVGILGGMGPEATADLFMKIISATPARNDQDHLHIIIDNRPQVPDRTAAIFGTGQNPLPELTRGIRLLLNAGVEHIAVPCNSVHYFHAELQEVASAVPVLHMMREVAAYLSERNQTVTKVGLLATSGTVRGQLYHKALADTGLEILVPEAADQERVMRAIYDDERGIKAGRYDWPRKVLVEQARRLLAVGAQAVIAGCTEIPLALHQEHIDARYVDATAVLARAVVRRAWGQQSDPLTGEED